MISLTASMSTRDGVFGRDKGDSKTVAKLDAGTSASVTWAITKELPSGVHHLELKRRGGSIGFTQFEVIP